MRARTDVQVVAKSKEHIRALGQHVDSVIAQHNQLGGDHEKGQTLCWQFLAERIGNCSGEYLRKCYQVCVCVLARLFLPLLVTHCTLIFAFLGTLREMQKLSSASKS